MDENLQKLKDQIASTTTVMGSASILIRGQAQRLRDLAQGATDFESLKVAVNAEADALNAADDDLSAAVAENTTPTE